jgi:hypothetical protein
MTANETIRELKRVVRTYDAIVKDLRADKDNYDFDYALGVFQDWLLDDSARRRLDLVYSRKLGQTILRIVKLLHKDSPDTEQLQHELRVLAFVVGPKRLELSAAAVTRCACCSD